MSPTAGGVHLRTVAAGEHGDHPGRAVLLGDEPLQLLLEAFVVVRAVPGRFGIADRLRGLEEPAERSGGEGGGGESGAESASAGTGQHVQVSWVCGGAAGVGDTGRCTCLPSSPGAARGRRRAPPPPVSGHGNALPGVSRRARGRAGGTEEAALT